MNIMSKYTLYSKTFWSCGVKGIHARTLLIGNLGAGSTTKAEDGEMLVEIIVFQYAHNCLNRLLVRVECEIRGSVMQRSRLLDGTVCA